MKCLMCLLGLVSLAAISCGEPFNPYDADAHVASTALPHPPGDRMWLRRNGETRLWWTDDLRRERLVYYASTWELVDRAEAAGVKFIEVTTEGVVGRNDRGDVVITLAAGSEPHGCDFPNH